MSNLEPLVKIGDWYYQAAYGHLLPVAPEMTNTTPVVLEPRLHSLLNYFLLHPNLVITKDTLIDDVWPPSEGTDAAVMRAVGALRKVLGDNVKAPLYIATISKKGYRWLCQIEPLTSSQFAPATASPLPAAIAQVSRQHAAVPNSLPWRFISSVGAALLLGGAGLAYLLASVTVVPFTQLPDTVKPLSAITGQEFWPTLSAAQQHAFYVYRTTEAAPQQLARQDLTSLQVSYSSGYYQQISQPQWLTDSQLLFRALDEQQQCYFYQQQVLPDFQTARKVLPCQQVIPQGLALLAEQWYWLDYASASQRYELWQRGADGTVTRVLQLPATWRSVDQLVVVAGALYLIAQYDFYRSRLLRVDLAKQQLTNIADFDQKIVASSSWDSQHALLTLLNKPLQLLNLKSRKLLSLGPMTWGLTQPQRYQQRILSTQYLDYTSDIVQWVRSGTQLDKQSSVQPSNRNERLFAANETQLAFVSERAGDNQIWLTQDGDSRQLSRLDSGQYIQQLLWHQQTLLAVVDNKLFQVSLSDGSLAPIVEQRVSGRYQSCDNHLYWTVQDDDGWQLMHYQQQQPAVLLSGVVNVKCAPGGLVLQFYNDSVLSFWSPDQPTQLRPLPVSLNWHHILPEQWTSNNQQLQWLNIAQRQLQSYDWHTAEISSYPWPTATLPLEIHSSSAGSFYSVQPRHYDTDIVWLQNRG
ncbi:hypothetical protein WG68_15465 [Arsukibacterium ikkense]|uniref:OmpR/PhoB-type domain-containing protein n=1 Tax=Arsukibacterium ikkense TaxID=336831 RepID=A0A0M2V1E0_9GAMM|nr:winged helix-turn-helix domain-containing protein [Arsukibacterium ikkense]KKO44451.1 hypothetical protein WG68_15465 [Arsukibacterium ikkense]